MIRPPRLRAGDVVRLVAPSGPVPRDAFDSGIAVLRQRYEVRFDEALFAREGFLAGSDERRLAELAAALGDADARAILMARGGYGLLRLLPFIDPDVLRAAPRPVVGFSDGTALLAFAARAGVTSIHGPGADPAGWARGRGPAGAVPAAGGAGAGRGARRPGRGDPRPRAGAAAGRQPRGLLPAAGHAVPARPRGRDPVHRGFGRAPLPRSIG